MYVKITSTLLDMGSVHVRIEELFYNNTCSYVILQVLVSIMMGNKGMHKCNITN